MTLLISIITGLLSGGGIGEIFKKLSIGKVGNAITGGIGGLLGGLGFMGIICDVLGNLTADPTFDAAATGVVGGSMLMTIVGTVKYMILKK